MATRDLYEQKILRALEGIEKQLSVQNKILKNTSEEPYPNGIIRYQDGSLVRRTLPVFTNPDGTKTPIIPSEHINYYVRYIDNAGKNRTMVIKGKALADEGNKSLIGVPKEILFCYEGEEK